MRRRIVIVSDKMQRGYRYVLSAPAGRDFDPQFRPDLTPKQMLELGVFCGKYLTDCRDEFPASWFARAKLSPSGRDCRCNYYFGVDASQRLSEWRRKGWIHPNDPRGWFQWYCRYYLGRRLPEEDARQIGRWKAMRRHVSQIRKHCEPGDPTCRPPWSAMPGESGSRTVTASSSRRAWMASITDRRPIAGRHHVVTTTTRRHDDRRQRTPGADNHRITPSRRHGASHLR